MTVGMLGTGFLLKAIAHNSSTVDLNILDIVKFIKMLKSILDCTRTV
jgi:hypothetical protein